jgi:hypothetical protein
MPFRMVLGKATLAKFIGANMTTQVNHALFLDETVAVKVIDVKMLKG